MCGIYGFSSRNAHANGTAFLKHAIESQRHRGPDGEGIVSLNSRGVGMVRLRIRADASEREPIRMPDGSIVAYNGEIYRDANGCIPHGGAGEVHALYGGEADGMYASIQYHPNQTKIQARRDAFGIKPLYVRKTEDIVAFSSELSPLYSSFGKLKIRRDAIVQFLAFGRPIDGMGFLEGVNPIPPGVLATADSGELSFIPIKKEQQKLFHSGNGKKPSHIDIRGAIRDSVKSNLVSNRKLGVALSGGLDSSIIAAELALLGVTDLQVVSVCMEGSSDGVGNLNDQYLPGNSWKSWNLSSGVFFAYEYPNALKQAIRVLGEPTQMTSAPLYIRLAEQASNAGVTVLLLGEGADELFLGYRSYLPLLENWGLRDFLLRPTEQRTISSLFDQDDIQRLNLTLDRFIDELPGTNDWERLRAAEFKINLLPLLCRADHSLMRMSIEGRTPFLHGDVLQNALRIPVSELLRNNQTKVYLREAYSQILPDYFASERKKPFRAPIASWFAGRLSAWLRRELYRGLSVFEQLGINPNEVKKIISASTKGDTSFSKIAFCLLTLLLWIDDLIEQDLLDEPDILASYDPPANFSLE